ncbi:MAG: hypothetical protein A2Z04_03535 [Chloroflexi bacterium RBG_16_57_9]|nr:MAG: hypothetical protein A2Z04_03535 [Chloroflexi bacterium RBG_16_57_9]
MPNSPEFHDTIRKAFTQQASAYATSTNLIVGNTEALRLIVQHLDPSPETRVLDVAAGTGFLSLALAECVREIVAYDLTPAMLAQAEAAAAARGLTNLRTQLGPAEQLPFPEASFDLVTCRLAIHHFADPARPVAEMRRVCRPDGRVALIDIIAPEDPAIATRYNALERARDPSHTVALSRSALRYLAAGAGLVVIDEYTWQLEVNFQNWVALTQTPAPVVAELRQALMADVASNQTGMQPHFKDDHLAFIHNWSMLIGQPV